jgi:hypothetical protein
MYSNSVLMNKHLLNFWKDLKKDYSIKAGEQFEDDAADIFFPDETYEMLHRTHDVNTNSKRFIRSSLNPDFQFQIRETRIQFWVECKLRFNNSDDALINVFKPGQLQRYKQYEHTFLFLETYRYDDQYLYFVPMWHLKYDRLYLNTLKPYEITMDPPIRPGLIKKYLMQ